MSNKHFKIVVKEAKKNESKSDGERAVDDYDTLIDGLKELGFEPSSNVRNGKIYPYRTRFTATKDGIKYGFTLNEDRTGEYLESIEVVGGSIYTGDPQDKDARVFKSVGEVLDALKQVDGNKSEDLNKPKKLDRKVKAYANAVMDCLEKVYGDVDPMDQDPADPYSPYFDEWYITQQFNKGVSVEDCAKSVHDSYRKWLATVMKRAWGYRESKKSESLSLKQKELKDMARYGEAEDITTISDAEAKELHKKGVETVGVSRGTYGMNGALLRDKDGKKYVITARSSNLFYFV